MFMMRKCQECGRPAIYKVTRIVAGKPEDTFYCDEHASKASHYIQKPPAPEAIKEWLKGIVEGAGGVGEKPAEIPDIICDSCGLSFEAYKRTLLLGCPDCYSSFEEYLIPELRKFHGETRHIGRKNPGGGEMAEEEMEMEFLASDDSAAPESAESEKVLSIPELRRQLKEAVEREDFVLAAEIRDRIRRRETPRSA